jgi:tetratricopeptide (TPR) repeat protein
MLTELYKESADNLKFALRVIVTLIGIAAALVVAMQFKNIGEYREAVREAKEAAKEAREASKHAQDWEDKTQGQFKEINEVVEAKLKEIENEGKIAITNLINEGEKQRLVIDALNTGLNAIKEKDFERAVTAFDEVAGMGLESPIIYAEWGMVLTRLAATKEGAEKDKLFGEACEKYNKAVEKEPNFWQAYFNWGATLCRE